MVALRVICFACIATGLLAGSANAQNDSKPLNLSLPPSSDMPAAIAVSVMPTSPEPATAAPASATPTHVATTGVNTAPGVYYGDTSGVPVNAVAANDPNNPTASCDDTTYNQPQVHGSVTAGVVAGNHVSGSYEAGTVNIRKPLGDCEHPTGSLNISVSGGQGRFNYQRRNH
jgi:hypothetical protein